MIYFAGDLDLSLFFLRREKCALISTLLTNEKRNANIRLFILVDLVRSFQVRERHGEACSGYGMNILRFSPVRNIKISVLSRHETSRYSEHDLFSRVTFRNGGIFEHIPHPWHAILSLGPSIDVMRISKGTLAGRGATRYLVIKGWKEREDASWNLIARRTKIRYEILGASRGCSPRSLPRLKLKQTPLSEPIRDTPPFPYSPAAGATCRLFKLLQWLRSTVETF